METSTKDYSTRELNGNIAVTQAEFLEKVLLPLQKSMTPSSYLSVVLSYFQSLLRLDVPISSELFLFVFFSPHSQIQPSSSARSRLGRLQNRLSALLSPQHRTSEARRARSQAPAAPGRLHFDADRAEHAAGSQRLRDAAELLQRPAGRSGWTGRLV